MLFQRQVNEIVNTLMESNAKATLASPSVIDGSRRGRHTVIIYAVEDTYIGGDDLTKENGLLVKSGDRFVMPVDTNMCYSSLNYIGKCTLTECF